MELADGVLKAFRLIGNDEMVAMTYGLLAKIHRELSYRSPENWRYHLRQAAHYFREAGREYLKFGNKKRAGDQLFWAGHSFHELGGKSNIRVAHRLLKMAAEVSAESGDFLFAGMSYFELAEIETDPGLYVQAAEFISKAPQFSASNELQALYHLSLSKVRGENALLHLQRASDHFLRTGAIPYHFYSQGLFFFKRALMAGGDRESIELASDDFLKASLTGGNCALFTYCRILTEIYFDILFNRAGLRFSWEVYVDRLASVIPYLKGHYLSEEAPSLAKGLIKLLRRVPKIDGVCMEELCEKIVKMIELIQLKLKTRPLYHSFCEFEVADGKRIAKITKNLYNKFQSFGREVVHQVKASERYKDMEIEEVEESIRKLKSNLTMLDEIFGPFRIDLRMYADRLAAKLDALERTILIGEKRNIKNLWGKIRKALKLLKKAPLDLNSNIFWREYVESLLTLSRENGGAAYLCKELLGETVGCLAPMLAEQLDKLVFEMR
jgi:hypothetical protein